MAQNLKPIAQGYLEDVTKLLSNFAKWESFDFKTFAGIWKEHYFGFIFMGRRDNDELTQFINETYSITSKFLFVKSFYMNVGAVFTLYALYRSQPQDVTVPIRIEWRHFEVIKRIKEEAFAKNYMSLLYVIDYLKKHAFLLLENQTLKGPHIRFELQKKETDDEIVDLMNTYKDNYGSFKAGSNITILKDLKEKYDASKKKFVMHNNLISSGKGIDWEDICRRMKNVDDPAAHMQNSLGARRAKLRAQAFKNKPKDAFGMDLDFFEEEREEYVEKPFTFSRQRRLPVEERKIGRPSRKKKQPEEKIEKESDKKVDISHLLKEQVEVFGPFMKIQTRNLRSKRNAYYEDSPAEYKVQKKSVSQAKKIPDYCEDVDDPPVEKKVGKKSVSQGKQIPANHEDENDEDENDEDENEENDIEENDKEDENDIDENDKEDIDENYEDVNDPPIEKKVRKKTLSKRKQTPANLKKKKVPKKSVSQGKPTPANHEEDLGGNHEDVDENHEVVDDLPVEKKVGNETVPLGKQTNANCEEALGDNDEDDVDKIGSFWLD